jgi:hypothetical protein
LIRRGGAPAGAAAYIVIGGMGVSTPIILSDNSIFIGKTLLKDEIPPCASPAPVGGSIVHPMPQELSVPSLFKIDQLIRQYRSPGMPQIRGRSLWGASELYKGFRQTKKIWKGQIQQRVFIAGSQTPVHARLQKKDSPGPDYPVMRERTGDLPPRISVAG